MCCSDNGAQRSRQVMFDKHLIKAQTHPWKLPFLWKRVNLSDLQLLDKYLLARPHPTPMKFEVQGESECV